MTRPHPRYEQYQTKSSDVARINSSEGDLSFVSVRVPFKSPLRFSVIFSEELTGFENSFYSERGWSRIFDDDRPGRLPPYRRGFFLPWTKESTGTPNVFATIWKMMTTLPPPLSMIHSDGEFLRAVFKGTPSEIRNIEVRDIRSKLQSTVAILAALPIKSKHRWVVPLSSLFFISICAISVILSFGIIQPKVEYFDLGTYSSIPILVATALVMVMTAVFNRFGYISPFRSGVFAGLSLFIVLLSLYMRLVYLFRGNPLVEAAEVVSIEQRHRKYSKEIAEYKIGVRSLLTRKLLELPLPLYMAKQCMPVVASAARVRIFTDPLGLSYTDSVVVPCTSEPESSSDSIDLLRIL